MAKTATRTARRVVEMPRAVPEPAAVPQPAAPTPAKAEADDLSPRTVRKLALIYADDERSFDTERMERSTIERFRTAYKNTPALHPDDGAADALALDVSGLITKGYELLFGSAATLAVRARKLTPRQASAFVNPARISKLVPRTEHAIEDKFGAKLRNLPPLAQLGIDIVATLGLMLQDAATMDEDEPANGAATHRPGQEVTR